MQRGRLADPQRRQRRRRALHQQPDPAHLDHRAGAGHAPAGGRRGRASAGDLSPLAGTPASGVMIASVTGRVAVVAGSGAVVEVGGVGLLVQCTPATLSSLRVGEPATLHTSLVVREDALTLYGFADADERATFELLQSATGVGPRLAQARLGMPGCEQPVYRRGENRSAMPCVGWATRSGRRTRRWRGWSRPGSA